MKDKTTVVVVDDERNILTSLGMALESEGYKVRTYGDGASALERLPSNRPTSLSSTSRCRAWMAWSCCDGYARRPTCR